MAVGADRGAALFLPAGLRIADGGWTGIQSIPDQIETRKMGLLVMGLLRPGQGYLAE